VKINRLPVAPGETDVCLRERRNDNRRRGEEENATSAFLKKVRRKPTFLIDPLFISRNIEEESYRPEEITRRRSGGYKFYSSEEGYL